MIKCGKTKWVWPLDKACSMIWTIMILRFRIGSGGEILERRKKIHKIERPIYQVQKKVLNIIFTCSLYEVQEIELSWQKYICKFKNLKDLEKGKKIKTWLRFI